MSSRLRTTDPDKPDEVRTWRRTARRRGMCELGARYCSQVEPLNALGRTNIPLLLLICAGAPAMLPPNLVKIALADVGEYRWLDLRI
jgi:hypothetical protein